MQNYIRQKSKYTRRSSLPTFKESEKPLSMFSLNSNTVTCYPGLRQIFSFLLTLNPTVYWRMDCHAQRDIPIALDLEMLKWQTLFLGAADTASTQCYLDFHPWYDRQLQSQACEAESVPASWTAHHCSVSICNIVFLKALNEVDYPARMWGQIGQFYASAFVLNVSIVRGLFIPQFFDLNATDS